MTPHADMVGKNMSLLEMHIAMAVRSSPIRRLH
jgi:hypothetical protein